MSINAFLLMFTKFEIHDFRCLGNTATSATPIRAGPVSNRPLLAVPKAGSGAATGSGSVNLAVMNKVTVLTTSNPPNKATPLTGGNVPRATATTIVRPPTSYPLTLKSPGSGATPLVSGVANTTSIRLTTGTPSQPSSIQLVPMSTLPASIRPQNNPVRPSIPSARGPTSFRPAATISDAVTIRTLVQSPGSGKPMNTGPAGMASITTTSTGTGFYKQVTITPPNSQKPINPGVATTTMRIPATSKMTVLPTPGSASPFQTVSLATTSQQINVPLAPGARAITAGKLISVTGSTSSPPGVPPISTGGGVTIHKSTIPVSSQSPRTISLPYGAPAQVTSLPKPVSQAIPVARVCPQQNVVTITTTVGNPIGSSATSGVLIPRSGTSGNPGQAVAINLSSNQTLNLTKSQQPMAPGAKITSITGNPSGGARLVSLPAQPVLEASSSPSRPSILRRREGDREPSMPETPPPRPDSRNDDAGSSSSGSTTLSATSSPGLGGTDRANLSGSEDPQPPVIQPSPSRKKPRKQTLTSTRPGSEWGENNHHSEPSEELKRKTPGKSGQTVSPLKTSNANYIRDKPHMSLLNSYRHTWKSRHNHFLRHSDVRPRGDANPTVNEVANQKHIMQVKMSFLKKIVESVNRLLNDPKSVGIVVIKK